MNISIFANGIVDFLHPGRGERYIREAGFETVALSLGGMISPRRPYVAGSSLAVSVAEAPSTLYISDTSAHALPEDVIKAAKAVKSASESADGTITGEVRGRCTLDRKELKPGEEYPADEDGLVEIRKTGPIRGMKYFLTDTTDEKLISELVDVLAGSGIKVLIKNRTRYYSGRAIRDRFCEPHEVLRVIDIYGSDRLGFCFDTGEANLCGQDPAEMLRALKGVTDAVIVKENDGIERASYLPFTMGRVLDWGSFFRGMRETGFDGELIFEIGSSMGAHPLPLRGNVVKRAFEAAEYFRWQIEMDRMVAKYPKRVLFGAGNMCRYYMRDYGRKYPPQFTVDNDKKVWGTVFEGLEVKSPDELKKLDEDTAIFICITYYTEIHEQLRDMGITNPIEYYNDEYPNTEYAGERLIREWSE